MGLRRGRNGQGSSKQSQLGRVLREAAHARGLSNISASVFFEHECIPCCMLSRSCVKQNTLRMQLALPFET